MIGRQFIRGAGVPRHISRSQKMFSLVVYRLVNTIGNRLKSSILVAVNGLLRISGFMLLACLWGPANMIGLLHWESSFSADGMHQPVAEDKATFTLVHWSIESQGEVPRVGASFQHGRNTPGQDTGDGSASVPRAETFFPSNRTPHLPAVVPRQPWQFVCRNASFPRAPCSPG